MIGSASGTSRPARHITKVLAVSASSSRDRTEFSLSSCKPRSSRSLIRFSCGSLPNTWVRCEARNDICGLSPYGVVSGTVPAPRCPTASLGYGHLALCSIVQPDGGTIATTVPPPASVFTVNASEGPDWRRRCCPLAASSKPRCTRALCCPHFPRAAAVYFLRGGIELVRPLAEAWDASCP